MAVSECHFLVTTSLASPCQVLRGLSGDTWPYLGTNLTTLQVGPVRTFSLSTWINLGNMTSEYQTPSLSPSCPIVSHWITS